MNSAGGYKIIIVNILESVPDLIFLADIFGCLMQFPIWCQALRGSQIIHWETESHENYALKT